MAKIDLLGALKHVVSQTVPVFNALNTVQHQLQTVAAPLLGIENLPPPILYVKQSDGSYKPNQSLGDYYKSIYDAIIKNPITASTANEVFKQLTGIEYNLVNELSERVLEWSAYQQELRACMVSNAVITANGAILNEGLYEQWIAKYAAGMPMALWGRDLPVSNWVWVKLPCVKESTIVKYNWLLIIALLYGVYVIIKKIFKR